MPSSDAPVEIPDTVLTDHADGDANADESQTEEDQELKEKKRKQREAIATANCGYGQAKKRVVHAFNTRMWPILEEGGWAKRNGDGINSNADVTYYMPADVTKFVDKYSRNKQYTERIKDVIDRILERRSSLESRAADAYLDEVGDLVELEKKKQEEVPRTSSRRSRGKSNGGKSGEGGDDDDDDEKMDEEEHHVSLSWKFNDRRHFPKVSSRIGEEYQATYLPAVGSKVSAEEIDDAHNYDQIFDPAKVDEAEKAGSNLNLTQIGTPLAEAAMIALHQGDYVSDSDKFRDALKNAKPMDGSDWTEEEKNMFHEAIFEHRKDLRKVAKEMGKSMCSVHTYYLGKYKQSDDYRLLKSVCQQEAHDKEPERDPNDDVCCICKEGGHLLMCDGCDCDYHAACLKPPLKVIPDGDWYCDSCLDKKLLDSRKWLLKQSNALWKAEETKKDSSDTNAKISSEQGDDKAATTPAARKVYSDEILNLTTMFAAELRGALKSGVVRNDKTYSDDI